MQEDSEMKIDRYALISVYDKQGIVEFAKSLSSLGYKIISTGGTAKILTESNISVIPIEKITGNPESFDGRMKTISFQIESGILFDRVNRKHQQEAKKLKIKPIDIVVCNFYPFEKKRTIENIDVGGPTMIRAAAKNYKNVLVIIDPSDYVSTIDKLRNKTITEKFRKYLAAKSFAHLSLYDSEIAGYLSGEKFPHELTIAGRKVINLRYGENPHQKAAFYLFPKSTSILRKLKKLWGRDLSLVNITDINAGIETVRMFDAPCSVVIKHNSACGIALGKTPQQSLRLAIEADPESAFGGVIVLNKTFNIKCAEILSDFKNKRKANMDIVASPKFEDKAIKLLSRVRKSIGVYQLGNLKKSSAKNFNIKWVDGGFIIQTQDLYSPQSFKSWEVVTKIKPTKKQLEQMKIAWLFITRVRSNSVIVVDKSIPMTRGIGSGQTSRIRSAKIALLQAGRFARGAILASDSFFPFDDCVKLAAKYKIGGIVQQGGSVNDNLSIKAADRAKIPMVFTHRRAFWH